MLSEDVKYEILNLKLKGTKQHDIALKFGISDSQVSTYLKKALSEYREKNIHEIKELVSIEEGRLDEMYLALKPRIERGEPRAIEMGVKISERRAKMLDLDAALRMEVSGSLIVFKTENMGEK